MLEVRRRSIYGYNKAFESLSVIVLFSYITSFLFYATAGYKLAVALNVIRANTNTNKSKYKNKEVNCLIQISKEEAMQLNGQYRIPFGENGIMITRSNRRHKYYLCELEKNIRCFNKVHNNNVVSIIASSAKQ